MDIRIRIETKVQSYEQTAHEVDMVHLIELTAQKWTIET